MSMKVKTDQSVDYMYVEDAAEGRGFKHIGYIRFRGESRSLFEKNDKLYYLVNWDHFNTTFYSVSVALIKNLKSEYEIVRS